MDSSTLKARIIQESLKLFSLKGFLSTSTQDIMQAANTSKGGLYNHFKSKDDIFFAVLEEARIIWREKNLKGLDKIDKPVAKAKKLLENYRDRYLKDQETFPGGCIFVTLSVELDDQNSVFADALNEGFIKLKAMIKRFLDQGKDSGEIDKNVNTEWAAEMIFSAMLGASVIYGTEKSTTGLNRCIKALLVYIDSLSPGSCFNNSAG